MIPAAPLLAAALLFPLLLAVGCLSERFRAQALTVLVAAPLAMWLGVSRENFIKVSKQVEGANKDGAVV